jgi:hypothetical protein
VWKWSVVSDWKLTVGGHRCVVLVVFRLDAEAAARERLPQEAFVRPAIAVTIRLDNCVARRQAGDKAVISAAGEGPLKG